MSTNAKRGDLDEEFALELMAVDWSSSGLNQMGISDDPSD
jgi:hypothetical protein